jgi:hypothetical protein
MCILKLYPSWLVMAHSKEINQISKQLSRDAIAFLQTFRL